jgi:LmbE family N-acetylglucosaminyl deacetylase
MGIELNVPGPDGLGDLMRSSEQADRATTTSLLEAIIRSEQPCAIVMPHGDDAHPEHICTHDFVVAALQRIGDLSCTLIKYEYWREMREPNVQMEVGVDDLLRILKAVSFHVGELERNQYHLYLPLKLRDNGRRAELVTGWGRPASAFPYSVLLQMLRYADGQCHPIGEKKALSVFDALAPHLE